MPNGRVALDLDVTSHEEAVIPRIARAGDRLGAVVDLEIAQNLSASCVGGLDSLLTVKKAAALVEIRGLADILRNQSIILAGFGDAIDLNGKKNGNAVGLEAARKGDRGAGAPAVAEKNDARGAFLVRGRIAVRIGGE